MTQRIMPLLGRVRLVGGRRERGVVVEVEVFGDGRGRRMDADVGVGMEASM